MLVTPTVLLWPGCAPALLLCPNGWRVELPRCQDPRGVSPSMQHALTWPAAPPSENLLAQLMQASTKPSPAAAMQPRQPERVGVRVLGAAAQVAACTYVCARCEGRVGGSQGQSRGAGRVLGSAGAPLTRLHQALAVPARQVGGGAGVARVAQASGVVHVVAAREQALRRRSERANERKRKGQGGRGTSLTRSGTSRPCRTRPGPRRRSTWPGPWRWSLRTQHARRAHRLVPWRGGGKSAPRSGECADNCRRVSEPPHGVLWRSPLTDAAGPVRRRGACGVT